MFTEDQQEAGRAQCILGREKHQDLVLAKRTLVESLNFQTLGSRQTHKLAYFMQREEHGRQEYMKGGGSTEEKVMAVEVCYPP